MLQIISFDCKDLYYLYYLFISKFSEFQPVQMQTSRPEFIFLIFISISYLTISKLNFINIYSDNGQIKTNFVWHAGWNFKLETYGFC